MMPLWVLGQNACQVDQPSDSLVMGSYFRKFSNWATAFDLGMGKDNEGNGIHICLDNHGHFCDWTVVGDQLQIAFKDTTEHFFVYRYRDCVILVPPESKPTFINDFRETQRLAEAYIKQQADASKPIRQKDLVFLLSKNYFTRDP